MNKRIKELEQTIINQQIEINKLNGYCDTTNLQPSDNLLTETLKGYTIIFVKEDGYKDHISQILLENKYGNRIQINPHVECMTYNVITG